MRKFPRFDVKEFSVFKRLASPQRIQDFLNALPVNFELGGSTSRSPLAALRRGEAHCMEGATIAAAALWYHGAEPLLLDLKTASKDEDHVVALFRNGGRWGAVSRTNHGVLRYRDPVFRDVRELTMSYFNEYFLDSGVKTLRTYSAPFSLLRFKDDWLTAGKDIWHVNNALDKSRHFKILRKGTRLRRADPIEIDIGKVTEWKDPKPKKSGKARGTPRA